MAKHGKGVTRNNGVWNCHAKLTPNEIRAIRALYRSDLTITQKQIGVMYGVSEQNIHSIISRKTWRHVE